MAKQGQHKNDGFDQTKSQGHNHPDRSQTITTGSPKKQETIERDAREHRDPNRQAQSQKNEWHSERADPPSRRDQPRSPDERGEMGEQLHGMPDRRVLPGDQHPDRYRHDLNPHPTAGQNHGMHTADALGPSAYDVKDAHRTWRDLSDADLKQLQVLREGTRLRQGAVYFDLNDPDRGEIKALGNMEAGPGNQYVAKDTVPYDVWNALIGVDNPERLDLADEPRART
jgi:hypothetical protein